MSYTINLTDGTIFAVVSPGTVDTESSMILVGKNYAGYGEFLNENFVHLLENGANYTPPTNPLIGQLWWDKTTNVMRVYTGQGTGEDQFKPIGGATAKATPPTGSTLGDLWWDSTAGQLKVWNGTTFSLIGPASTSQQGTSGAVVETINDSSNNPRVVVKLFSENELVAIVSRGPAFSPQIPIPGFSGVISPGIQLSTSVAGARFSGTASDSAQLNGLTSAQFLRSDQSGSLVGNLSVEGSSFTVGINGAAINTNGTDVFIRNQTQNGNLTFTVNSGGSTTNALSILGSGTEVGVRGIVNLNTSGVGNIGSSTSTFNTIFVENAGVKGVTNLNPNGVGNIGSATNAFNTVHAKATSAQYADVAERFAADAEYEPGTVVEIGGTAEITKSLTALSENVFGVISTNAAYLMNSTAGNDKTHPPVAMAGRVPVKVIGVINKGDRLVSAGNGFARSAKKEEVTPYNVIGRALGNKLDASEGLVEAIVAIKN